MIPGVDVPRPPRVGSDAGSVESGSAGSGFVVGGVPGELVEVGVLLDRFVGLDRLGLSDGERMAALDAVRLLASRCQGLLCVLAGEVEVSGVAVRATGAKAVSYLAAGSALTRRAAGRLVGVGRRLIRFGSTVEAVLAGRVSFEQADVISDLLDSRVGWLDEVGLGCLEDCLLEQAGCLDAAGLRQAGPQLTALVDPRGADVMEGEQVEREYRRAVADRRLSFSGDGHGTMFFKGCLPYSDGLLFKQTVDAFAAQLVSAYRAAQVVDPALPDVSKSQARADGLVALVETAAQAAPKQGGVRPHLTVTCDVDQLKAGLGATTLADGQPLPVSVLRQLSCDADLLPVVMDGVSGPIDYGRTKRTAPNNLRRLLELRDTGCVFPGCDVPVEHTDVHHVNPWWAGGQTNLNETVLLCRYHHRLVEPTHLKNQQQVEP
ncbi:MAG: HNH endonuclease, partial [Bifidobacteriaceae bacterium]|nr:HNH endonuclease [Bifidobacteriaceae bacterium]